MTRCNKVRNAQYYHRRRHAADLIFKCEACGGYFDGRELGVVLEHEEPLPIRHAIKCSIVVGSSARRRRASAQ